MPTLEPFFQGWFEKRRLEFDCHSGCSVNLCSPLESSPLAEMASLSVVFDLFRRLYPSMALAMRNNSQLLDAAGVLKWYEFRVVIKNKERVPVEI